MEFLEQLTLLLLGMGISGLFLIAFVDSAGVPTGGGPDLVLLLLAVHSQGPADLVQLVPAAVVGSALGCLVFYYIGRSGGERILSRFAAQKQVSIKERIDRHGLWTMVVAMLGPPPYPTKLFVLSAGVFEMRPGSFLTGILLGRTLRYGVVGYLAVRFGELAGEQLAIYYPVVFLAVVCLASLYLFFRWQRRRSVHFNA